jgi:hypothetical protein
MCVLLTRLACFLVAQLLTNSTDGFMMGDGQRFSFVSPGLLHILQYEDSNEELMRCAAGCRAAGWLRLDARWHRQPR